MSTNTQVMNILVAIQARLGAIPQIAGQLGAITAKAAEANASLAKVAENTNGALDKAARSLMGIGRQLAGSFATFLSIGGIIEAARKSLAQFAEAEATQRQLAMAVELAGANFREVEPLISAATSALAKYGLEGDRAAKGISALLTRGLGLNQAMRGVEFAAKLAAAGEGNFEEALQSLILALNGVVRPGSLFGQLLGQLRQELNASGDQAGNFDRILGALDAKITALADSRLNTISAQTKALGVSFKELSESVGGALARIVQLSEKLHAFQTTADLLQARARARELAAKDPMSNEALKANLEAQRAAIIEATTRGPIAGVSLGELQAEIARVSGQKAADAFTRAYTAMLEGKDGHQIALAARNLQLIVEQAMKDRPALRDILKAATIGDKPISVLAGISDPQRLGDSLRRVAAAARAVVDISPYLAEALREDAAALAAAAEKVAEADSRRQPFSFEILPETTLALAAAAAAAVKAELAEEEQLLDQSYARQTISLEEYHREKRRLIIETFNAEMDVARAEYKQQDELLRKGNFRDTEAYNAALKAREKAAATERILEAQRAVALRKLDSDVANDRIKSARTNAEIEIQLAEVHGEKLLAERRKLNKELADAITADPANAERYWEIYRAALANLDLKAAQERTARAEKIYQDALAATQDRVTSGLLNQTEARRENVAAARIYAEALREEMRLLEQSGLLTQNEIDRYEELGRTLRRLEADMERGTLIGKIRTSIVAWGDLTEQVGNFTVNALENFAQASTDALMNLIAGTRSAGEAFAAFARAVIADLIRMIVQMLIFKAVSAAIGFLGFGEGGPVPAKMATGGPIAGSGDDDSVPALLTPGEFVVSRRGVAAIGLRWLSAINAGLVRAADLAMAIPAAALPRPQYAFAGGGAVTPIGGQMSRGAGIPAFVLIGPREIDKIGADSRFRTNVRASLRDGRDIETALSRRKGHKI